MDEVAAAIWDLYRGEPVMPGLAMLLREYRGSADEVMKVAGALAAARDDRSGGSSLTVLTFGAHAAHLVDDHSRARTLMDQALAGPDEPALRSRLANHLMLLGRVADALDLLAALVADPSYDGVVAQAHQEALEEAQRRLDGKAPGGECPCGSRSVWSECCRPRMAAALAAFCDRSGLYAMRSAVAEFVAESPYERPVARHVADWLATAVQTDSWTGEERDALERLANEHAWVAAGLDEMSDDDHDNVLTALAQDPTTTPSIAAAATAWHEHVRYGLWQVADPTTANGLWCVDLTTGRELYVAFAPEQIEGLPRWAVLLGAVVPIDGAWRTTGTLMRVSPQEADALCETVRAAADVIIDELGGHRNRGARARARRRTPSRATPPHNVYAYLQDPASPPAAALLTKVTGVVLPQLLADVQAARATPPALTNTDGDPLRMIKARLQVHDPARVATRLANQPDFDADDDGRLTWFGREVPAGQRAAMLAEAKAQLRAQGHRDADITDPDQPQRWVRGQIQRRDNVLTVEVNSEQRLHRLLALLEQLDAQPTIIDRSHVDPTQDLPWPAGHRPVRGGLAPADEGWERHWLDERLPALRNRTPRQVAATDDWPLLEGLLRQLEYDADLVDPDGGHGADTAWLREQLNLPANRLT